jgi:hypothetical protein
MCSAALAYLIIYLGSEPTPSRVALRACEFLVRTNEDPNPQVRGAHDEGAAELPRAVQAVRISEFLPRPPITRNPRGIDAGR